jgi:hypothetical protein
MQKFVEDQSTRDGAGAAGENGSIGHEEKSDLTLNEGTRVSSISVGKKNGKTFALKSTSKDAEKVIDPGNVRKSGRKRRVFPGVEDLLTFGALSEGLLLASESEQSREEDVEALSSRFDLALRFFS